MELEHIISPWNWNILFPHGIGTYYAPMELDHIILPWYFIFSWIIHSPPRIVAAVTLQSDSYSTCIFGKRGFKFIAQERQAIVWEQGKTISHSLHVNTHQYCFLKGNVGPLACLGHIGKTGLFSAFTILGNCSFCSIKTFKPLKKFRCSSHWIRCFKQKQKSKLMELNSIIHLNIVSFYVFPWQVTSSSLSTYHHDCKKQAFLNKTTPSVLA